MTIKECRDKVESCLDNGTLTKWEDSFLTSLTDQLDRGRALTIDQEDKLVQIYDKIYGGNRWR